MFIIDFFKKVGSAIGGGAKKVASVVADFSQDIYTAFVPLMQTEAAEFVRDFREVALRVAVAAAEQYTSNGDKIKYFGKEILREAKVRGIPFVKEHLVNLLRECIVSELKHRGVL